MEYEEILYQPGRVARIILNRPNLLNAQSRLLLQELNDAFVRADNDGDVRVIVLSGAGAHFSAGHDVKEMSDPSLPPEDPWQRYQRMKRVYVEDHLRWRNLTKPTIAMVHGYCIWGGWMIASAMDLIFASDDALFLANPYPADFWAVTWDIGPRKAKEILFEHRFLTAREAMDMGFVNRVYPRTDLERETLAYAARVADNPPFDVYSLKYIVNQTLDMMGYSTSVVASFHNSRMLGAGTPAHPGYGAAFGDARNNPHTNRVRKAMERLKEDRAKLAPQE